MAVPLFLQRRLVPLTGGVLCYLVFSHGCTSYVLRGQRPSTAGTVDGPSRGISTHFRLPPNRRTEKCIYSRVQTCTWGMEALARFPTCISFH